MLTYLDRDALTFKDLIDFKILLDDMFDEILLSPRQETVLYGLNRSMGFWQEVYLSPNYHLSWARDDAGEKVAFSIARFPEGRKRFFIDYVYVRPEHRGRGIAKRLMSDQMDFAHREFSLEKEDLLLRSRRLEPIAQDIKEDIDALDGIAADTERSDAIRASVLDGAEHGLI